MKEKLQDVGIRPSKVISEGEIWDEGFLDSHEILEYSEQISFIYIEIIEKLSLSLSAKYSIPHSALEIIIRSGIVPITSCFFDRLIRLNKIIKSSVDKPSINEEFIFPIPNTIEEFSQWAMESAKYNQSVLSFLAETWDLEKIHGKEIDHIFDSKFQQPPSFVNNIFSLSRTKNKFTFINLIKLVNKFTKMIPAFGRFPVLGFSNAEGSLHKRLFYLKNFKKVNTNWAYAPVTPNISLREDIFSKSQLELSTLNVYLVNCGFSSKQIIVINELYFNFLKLTFPLQILEGLQHNYNSAQKALKPYKAKALLGSNAILTNSLFISGVAKSMGKRLINVQHGGGYGYQKNQSAFLEVELPNYDQFLTWGWTELPKHPALSHLQVYPLASPWLSERKNYWKGYSIDAVKRFDVLWMPNNLKRFIWAPEGSKSNRRDVKDEFSSFMIDFISHAAKSKIKIFCKPYSPSACLIMSQTYDKLEEIGGDYYECSEKYDKGLTFELLEQCKLVFFDQPSTGFFECLNCNIPTMVLVPSFYEFEDWCINDFKLLEESGLLHYSSKSLIDEMEKFLLNPSVWMNNSKRKLIIKNFSIKYALTDDKWWVSWRTFLKQLKKDINAR